MDSHKNVQSTLTGRLQMPWRFLQKKCNQRSGGNVTAFVGIAETDATIQPRYSRLCSGNWDAARGDNRFSETVRNKKKRMD